MEQTFHFGAPTPGASTGAGAYNPTKAVTELASGGKTGGTIIDEFQIYWVEWIDDETVAIGTNGVETLRVTKAMTEQNGGRWPFSYSINSEGLYYIITMMFFAQSRAEFRCNGYGDELSGCTEYLESESGYKDSPYGNRLGAFLYRRYLYGS